LTLSELHRRLGALLGLAALAAFVSGAGLDAPSVIPAGAVLLLAVFMPPGERWSRRLEPLWRGAALLLAARAALRVVSGAGDPVLPMVDLLLLLLCAESVRQRDGSGDARHFALTFALLIASAAYRPGPLFGLLFIVYVVSATVMLVVGHLTREARLHAVEPPPADRRLLLRIAGLSSIVLLLSAVVFLFFPRISEGWAARGTPLVSRAIVGFSDRVTLGTHGTRIESNPEIVLRIEFPAGAPVNRGALHWRGRSYNRFDGVSWSRVEYGGPRSAEVRGWPAQIVEQVVYARPLGEANVLFGLHPIVDITPISRIRPVRLRGGDFLYAGDVEPAYRVRSLANMPAPAQLRSVEPAQTPEVIAHLQVPAVTARMMQLADSLRASAPTMYDHVLAVERYLKTQFEYTLDLPPTRREATLDHFLFVRRAGHCEYFSTAMAILLRAGGVATRNVNGFLGGEWNEFGQYLTVTQNNAHSWVEVYFPGYGWVTFDPTPPGAALSIARGARGLGGLRMFVDGMNHRWGKWILDYNLGTQAGMLRRITQPLGGAGAESVDEQGGGNFWPVTAALALLAGTALLLRRLRERRRTTLPAVSRTYLAVRRAWQRAGQAPAEAQPPLAFAAALTDAPGSDAVRRVVDLYVRVRFGGAELGAAEAAEMRSAASTACRAAAAARTAARQSTRGSGSGSASGSDVTG
jgi:protein-glutamine gamma-glutamyltransferase